MYIILTLIYLIESLRRVHCEFRYIGDGTPWHSNRFSFHNLRQTHHLILLIEQGKLIEDTTPRIEFPHHLSSHCCRHVAYVVVDVTSAYTPLVQCSFV